MYINKIITTNSIINKIIEYIKQKSFWKHILFTNAYK